MRIRTTGFALTLVFVGGAPSQVTVKAFAETELKVEACVGLVNSPGMFWCDSRRIPIGVDLGTSMSLSARVNPSAYPLEVASAQTQVSLSSSTPSVTVIATAESTFGGAPAPFRVVSGSVGIPFVGNQVAIVFAAGVPTAGYLEVVVTGNAVSSANFVKFGKRIINSSTPVVLTNRPLKVVVGSHVRTSLAFPGVTTQTSRVTVTFKPRAGVLRTIGTPCGPEFGAVYERTATLKPEFLTLLVRGSHAPVYGLYAFGVQGLSLPLPPLGCVLRTNPLVTVPAVVTSTGEATLALPLPATVGIGQYFIQYAAVVPHAGGAAWTMSNALDLRVQ